MPYRNYKVEQKRYSHSDGSVVTDQVDVHDAIRDAIFTQPTYSGSDSRETRSIEDKINVLGNVVSRLMERLLKQDTLTPDTLKEIMCWECELRGKIVQVPDEDEDEPAVMG